MKFTYLIVYSSPAGSTRLVAETIRDCLAKNRIEASMLDLATKNQIARVFDKIQAAGERICLFIGSPVYRDVAVPPIMRFIDNLPVLEGAVAVPFVTWGQACSGVALWQMGNGLRHKGFRIAGAARVLAVHSLMWQSSNPAGQGHPNQSDLIEVEKLVNTLLGRISAKEIESIAPAALDYQAPVRAGQMKEKIDAPWMNVPKSLDSEKCTCCGLCRDECPAAAIDLSPYPQFDQNCFDCFNCIRLCPEDAIEPAITMSQIEEHIRERVRTIDEKPGTRIFL